MLPYRSYLRHPARILRKNMTEAERILWSRVRRKQILGIQFYRQKPIERFIVDSYAPKANLVVEVDGEHHREAAETMRDIERDAILKEMGLTILRFTNFQILEQIDTVAKQIEDFAKNQIPPLKKGGWGDF